MVEADIAPLSEDEIVKKFNVVERLSPVVPNVPAEVTLEAKISRSGGVGGDIRVGDMYSRTLQQALVAKAVAYASSKGMPRPAAMVTRPTSIDWFDADGEEALPTESALVRFRLTLNGS